jgi:hypothetical protein
VSGTGEPGTTIKISNMSCSNEPIVVDTNGEWRCLNISPSIKEGTIIVVTSTSNNGNISAGSIISGSDSSIKKVCKSTDAYNYSTDGVHDESLCEYLYYSCRDTEASNYSRFGEHKQSKCTYPPTQNPVSTENNLNTLDNFYYNPQNLSDYTTNANANTDDYYSGMIDYSSDFNPLGGESCTPELIVSDKMKRGDKNGQYSSYNKGIVTQIHILQAHMNRLLLDEYGKQASGPVDGLFGPLTQRGVERLQQRLNVLIPKMKPLKIDGIVGPFTRDAINHSC